MTAEGSHARDYSYLDVYFMTNIWVVCCSLIVQIRKYKLTETTYSSEFMGLVNDRQISYMNPGPFV